MGTGIGSGQGEARLRPVTSGRISSPFGMRHDPKTGMAKMHNGVDFAVPLGTPVRASADGTVTPATGWQNPGDHNQGFGLRITLDHGSGVTSKYGHLDSVLVGPGDHVTRGQVIGHSGDSGRSTGPHLHYEERRDDRPVAPVFEADRLLP